MSDQKQNVQQEASLASIDLIERDESIMPAKALRMPRNIFELTSDQIERLKLLANMMSESKFNSTGNDRLKAGDYFIIMLKGLELGLPPLTAMDFINIINGTPVTDGKGMLALINRSGLLDDMSIDSTDEYCEITMKRVGRSTHVERFTMDDAQRYMVTQWRNGQKVSAPLAEKDNWKSQPRVMLKWRCVAAACRYLFPDVIGGLYTREEINPDIIVYEDGRMEVPAAPAPAPKAPPPSQQPPQQDAKARLKALLNELGATSQDDFNVYLEELGIDRFSDFDGAEDELHKRIRQIHARMTKPIKKERKSDNKTQSKPTAAQVSGVGIAEEAVFNGQFFLFELDDGRKVRFYGRKKLIEALGEYAETLEVDLGELKRSSEPIQVGMLRVHWEDKGKYLIATEIMPLDFEDPELSLADEVNTLDEYDDPFADLPPLEDEEELAEMPL